MTKGRGPAYIDPPGQRICSKCHAVKPLSGFCRLGRYKKGYVRFCNQCVNRRSLARRRGYYVCGNRCTTKKVAYQYTDGGIDIFARVTCGGFCCREKAHMYKDEVCVCILCRTRICVPYKGSVSTMRHVTDFDRVLPNGEPYPKNAPIEVHFMIDGKARRVARK